MPAGRSHAVVAAERSPLEEFHLRTLNVEGKVALGLLLVQAPS